MELPWRGGKRSPTGFKSTFRVYTHLPGRSPGFLAIAVPTITVTASRESRKELEAVGQEVVEEVIVENEDDKEDDEMKHGERIPKAARRPNAPTKAMIAEHYPCHAHYRSWCPDCVAGRSLEAAQERGRSGRAIGSYY